MIKAIKKEIALTNDFIDEPVIESIYFGGGTPSLLSADEFAGIIESIHQKFRVTPNAEITLEANPDDINSTILSRWLNAGVNRLSVGIQSFDDNELRWMNRSHNASQSLKCIDEIKLAGYVDFSVDLIYGSPLSTTECLVRNTGLIFQKEIPHISCYALTVEPGTRLDNHIKKKLSPGINEDFQASQFSLLTERMQDAGYEHYEISNFAKPGSRSRHNSNYWQGKPYFGFGPSAHSFNGKIRKWNIANNALYIQSIGNNIVPFEQEELTTNQQFNEYIMTSLRTIEGINIEKVRSTFGEYAEGLFSGSKKYIDNNLMISSGNHLVLTSKGKFLADGIASSLFVVR